MARVLIRNVADAVLEAHRVRAKSHGRTLEQELRGLIEKSARSTREERLAAAEKFQRLTPPGRRSDPATLVREDRDR
jgi:plasmid stability protein